MDQKLVSALLQRPNAVPDWIAAESDAGRILLRVFEVFDHAGIPYCVLHGYEDYPHQVKSDVDCIIDRNTRPRHIVELLHRNRQYIGADVVRCQGGYVVLAGKSAGGLSIFLTLDLSADCEFNDLPFLDGHEVLTGRRRYRRFWIPAVDVEFGAYLARTIAKGDVDDLRARRLRNLYQQDPARCAEQVARFWKAKSGELIISALRTGRWDSVNRNSDRLRAELRQRAILLRPSRVFINKLRALARRIVRLWRPDGVAVVLLGPDGAGKSSVIEALGPKLAQVLPHCTCWGFAPALLSLIRRGRRLTDQPHALPARSLLTSLARAAYWLAYHMVSFVALRVALARSNLVLYDRHFVDILVDSKRYRYGGPIWILRLLWRLIPKPDLIVLLDAPPEVLQARKQEVPFEMTAFQCQAYRSLVCALKNGRVVDADRPLGQVVDRVSELVLQHLHTRLMQRFDLEYDCRMDRKLHPN